MNCYFKDAQLINVNFTGCRFINCDFELKLLKDCIFDYAKFESCFIPYDAMQPNLPQWSNMRWRLCKNLGLQAMKDAETDEFRKYLFEEKRASEQHFWAIIRKPDEYYKNKYSFYDQARAIFLLIVSKLNRRVWAYGENIYQLFATLLFIIILYGFLFFILGHRVASFEGDVFASFCYYFNVPNHSGPVVPTHLAATESFVGVIWTGFFIAALFKHVSRRGSS